MSAVIHRRLQINRRRLAKRLLKLFDQIAVSDSKSLAQNDLNLMILDPSNSVLMDQVIAVKSAVQSALDAR